MSDKTLFASTLNEFIFDGASSNMTECENYGMTYGCDEDCPVLERGECELTFGENKELMLNIVREITDNFGSDEVLKMYGQAFLTKLNGDEEDE